MKLLTFVGFLLAAFMYSTPINAQKEVKQEEIKLPSSGNISYLTEKEAIAPFRIVTRKPGNYFIRLEDLETKKTVQTIFVKGGETIQIDVPLGTYIFKYAVGNKWYGEELLFGDETKFYKADDTFDFKIIGDQISGYVIELYKQVSGNLEEESISPDEFKR